MYGNNVAHVHKESDALQQLDAFLNAQILSGSTEDQRRWWNVKCVAKRHLASLLPSDAESAAAKILLDIVGGGEAR